MTQGQGNNVISLSFFHKGHFYFDLVDIWATELQKVTEKYQRFTEFSFILRYRLCSNSK